jgi:pimeloyl-ACP methyl ester carboxylesterase
MSWLSEYRQLDLPEGSIRYRELGAGPAILFVHGLLVNGNLWREVVPRLTDRFRCIVPDWPLGSHELPMKATADLTPPGIAETIVRFADALGLEDVTLVANDTGGAISQMAVARHPARFARLVLTNGDAFENFLPLRYRYLCWSAYVPGMLFLLAQTLRLGMVRQLPIAYGPLTTRPIPADIAQTYVKPAAESAAIRENLARTLRAISPKDTLAAAEGLRRFTGSALLVWSADDSIFPFDHAERLATLLPNARVERITGSRCFVPEDQPALLATKIRQFLDATGTKQASA